MRKYWQKINEGDTACVVAPSYGISINDDIDANMAITIKIVESYGLKPLVYSNMLALGNHTLFDDKHLRLANSDEVKVVHLIDAFNNPSCDVIWSFKGGYGAIRLLSSLSKELEPQKVKPFIGFSDITILHSYINDVWGWPSIHFGMPGSLQNVMQRDDTKQSLQDIIFGTKQEVTFKLKSLNQDLSSHTVINGVTAGGNMFNFDKLLGTKYSPILKSKIIVLEDVEEPARKIDGFLHKLMLMEDFGEIEAIVFANFTPQKDQPIFNKIFINFAENVDVPVFQLDPANTIGHGDINNAFPLGTEAVIELVGSCLQLSVHPGLNNMPDSSNEL